MKALRGPEASCYVTVSVTLSHRNRRSTKQAWPAQSFTAGFIRAGYEKTSKAGVFDNISTNWCIDSKYIVPHQPEFSFFLLLLLQK